MTRKKILLVIVEGSSDETALGYVLSQIYDKEKVFIHVVHGDITTRNNTNALNIVSKVGDEVKRFMDNNPYKPGDFKGIIHIVDMDGAFIPDDAVAYDAGCKECVYSDTWIRTDNVDGIIKRNHQKKEVLLRLVKTGIIRTIPYKIYYMSCNMDHVLYDKPNSSDEEKENDSYEFAARYKDDIGGFLRFMCESDFSVDRDYKDSWDFIKEGLHSLERHSNLCICLKEENAKEF